MHCNSDIFDTDQTTNTYARPQWLLDRGLRSEQVRSRFIRKIHPFSTPCEKTVHDLICKAKQAEPGNRIFLRIIMTHTQHHFHQLFEQLGLANDAEGISQFIRQHAPLPAEVSLADAPFWNPAQAAFLREALLQDADWAELVDQLNLAFRADTIASVMHQ
jgi:hypothetical protein